ncbi:hypothetical protein ACWG0P_10915 [Amedibacillus sp. YH-ame6]
MLFKKLHKQEKADLNAEINADESFSVESQDELEKRLQRNIKSQNRRRKTKSFILTFILILGLMGGFKSLFTLQKAVLNSTAVNDYAFAEKYLSTYFKYPKVEEDNKFISQFTTGNWAVEYANNQVKSVITNSVKVYQVTTDLQNEMKIYAQLDMTVTDKNEESSSIITNVVLGVIHIENSYLVNSPISMVRSDVQPMEETMKKEYTKNSSSVAGSDCTNQEKEELTNSVKLFISTYNTDFTQAQLLMKNANDLKPLDPNTQLEFESVGIVKKDRENYIISTSVLIKTKDVLFQRRNYKFTFEISSNKIVEMEEY